MVSTNDMTPRAGSTSTVVPRAGRVPELNGRVAVAPLWLRPWVLMMVGSLLQLWWMDHALWNAPHITAIIVGASFFALGAWPARNPANGPSRRESILIVRTTRRVGQLMILGYVLWGMAALQRGLSIGDVTDFITLQPEASERLKRTVFAPTLMSTFFVNLTVVYFGLAATTAFKIPGFAENTRRRFLRVASAPLFWPIAILTVLRAVGLSERLIAFEMLLGIVGAYFVARPLDQRVGESARRWRRLRRRTPAMLLVGSLLFFGLAEIPRSFAAKRAEGVASSPIEYTADRLVTYYGAAGENGAIALRYVPPIWDGGLYLSGPAFTALIGNEEEVGDRWFGILDKYASREFNNSGGWTALLVDFGIAGGLALLALVMFLLGHWWAISMRRPVVGAIVVPVVLLTSIELPRLLYLGQTRAVVALGVAALLHVRISSRTHAGPAALMKAGPPTVSSPVDDP